MARSTPLVVAELRALEKFVLADRRSTFKALLDELDVMHQPKKSYWDHYRATQEFVLTYPDERGPQVVVSLDAVAQLLQLSVPSVRQRLSNGHGWFTTRTGIKVERV